MKSDTIQASGVTLSSPFMVSLSKLSESASDINILLKYGREWETPFANSPTLDNFLPVVFHSRFSLMLKRSGQTIIIV